MSPCIAGCAALIVIGYLALLARRVPWWVPLVLVTVGALGLLALPIL